MKRRTAQAGLSLIELLVALALALIVLMAAGSFQNSTMSLTSTLDGQSQRLGVLTDLSGYLGSRAREAAGYPDNLTLNGAACKRSAARPCLALLLPQLSTDATKRANGVVDKWRIVAYRYAPRSDVPADSKVPGAWLDQNALALFEERYALPATGCAPPALPPAACLTAATLEAPPGPLPLFDALTLGQADGSTFAPFEVVGSSIVLRFRAVGQRRGEAEYTPALGSDPYELRISPRNAP